MLSLAFEAKFVAYLDVASLSILLWDILNNLKNDYHLLFRHRPGLPTMIYFVSRISMFAFVLIVTIASTTPSLACTPLERTYIAFFLLGDMTTLYLSYLRVCAMWHWNHFIVGFFAFMWITVIALSFTIIYSLSIIEVEDYCVEIIVAESYLYAIFAAAFFNNTFIFLAVTYGVCKNTVGRDLTFGDCVLLMRGQNLPTFSKAVLHDSQVSYLFSMGAAVVAFAWFCALNADPTSAFRLALIPPYVVLVNIMFCRVFRNTRLGLYNNNLKVSPLQPNDPKSQRNATESATISWKPSHDDETVRAHSITPVHISVSQVVESQCDYSLAMEPQRSVVLSDFGMV